MRLSLFILFWKRNTIKRAKNHIQALAGVAYVTAKKDLTFLFNNICYNRIVTGNEMIGEHYE